jgi:1-phosphofructokinase
MIYTVTFNPAIDYIVHMDGFRAGYTNRTVREEYYFGGKGINVSTILDNLGVETTALGFVSGFTGKALAQGLEEQGMHTDFIGLEDGFTRINVKIKDDGAKAEAEDFNRSETEINGQGPTISPEAVDELFRKIEQMTPEDILVVSGSVPKSMPDDIYERIMQKTSTAGIMTVVDATGSLLLKVLQYGPFLIKPNNDEVSEMLNKHLETTEEIVWGARELRKLGARNVLVSRGAKGAVLVSENDEVITADAIKCDAVNTVGAGDSMVAGFLAGYMKTKDYSYALKLGTAAGAATAAAPGLASGEEIERMLKK